jgi:hypothetical protein
MQFVIAASEDGTTVAIDAAARSAETSDSEMTTFLR